MQHVGMNLEGLKPLLFLVLGAALGAASSARSNGMFGSTAGTPEPACAADSRACACSVWLRSSSGSPNWAQRLCSRLRPDFSWRESSPFVPKARRSRRCHESFSARSVVVFHIGPVLITRPCRNHLGADSGAGDRLPPGDASTEHNAQRAAGDARDAGERDRGADSGNSQSRTGAISAAARHTVHVSCGSQSLGSAAGSPRAHRRRSRPRRRWR